MKNDIAAHQPDPQRNRKQILTHKEKQALATLKEKDDLIISKADKGGAVVFQNVTDYIQEAKRQLRDTEFCKKVDRDLTMEHTEQINNAIDQFRRENLLPEHTAKDLKTTNAKPARFYTLPKIHK